jgi:hypothetical protein
MEIAFASISFRAKLWFSARHVCDFTARQAVAGFHLRGKPSRVPPFALQAKCPICISVRFLMPIRLKKLIGTFLLVALVVIYAMLATMIAVAQLAQSHWLTHLAFFAFSGLLWILPAMVIIKWMAGPLPEKN